MENLMIPVPFEIGEIYIVGNPIKSSYFELEKDEEIQLIEDNKYTLFFKKVVSGETFILMK